jgi:hypothetical protein
LHIFTKGETVKIYDHPLEPAITVIEIEKSDEAKDFLNEIIDGFERFGKGYHSASFDDKNGKDVMYIDCREKSNIFSGKENDVICALTIGLIENKIDDTYDEMLDACVTIAEAAGNDDLMERLINKPPEFFDMFKNLKKVA